jgi:hypothetical protein
MIINLVQTDRHKQANPVIALFSALFLQIPIPKKFHSALSTKKLALHLPHSPAGDKEGGGTGEGNL